MNSVGLVILKIFGQMEFRLNVDPRFCAAYILCCIYGTGDSFLGFHCATENSGKI